MVLKGTKINHRWGHFNKGIQSSRHNGAFVRAVIFQIQHSPQESDSPEWLLFGAVLLQGGLFNELDYIKYCREVMPHT